MQAAEICSFSSFKIQVGNIWYRW